MPNRFTQWFASLFTVMINDADIEDVHRLLAKGDKMSARMVAGRIPSLSLGEAEAALDRLEHDGVVISTVDFYPPSPTNGLDQPSVHMGVRMYEMRPLT